MILSESFPRATVFWILLAQCAVFLPHISNVPVWLSVLYFSCLAWRFGIYQGRWSYPSKWLKILLFLAGFVSVFASYQTISGAKGGVALLLIAFAYKTLEMKERRDAYLVVMLAYFIVACAFLFQRSIFAAIYLLICTALISAALISMNHLPKKSIDLRGLWLSSKILLQALPLMIFLFIFFPQLPPLFQVNLGGGDAKTGLSDSMSPGSISDLTQSGELVFRASFKDQNPLKEQMYWRAQIFERFDGITWKMSDKKPSLLRGENIFPLDNELMKLESGVENTISHSVESNPGITDISSIISQKNLLSYEILQEASDQTLLFSLATAWSDASNIRLNNDFTLDKTSKVSQLFQYQLSSNLNYRRDLTLSDLSRTLNLSLPVYGNKQATSLAQELRRGLSNDFDFFLSVKDYFLSKPFEYTLKPPRLGSDPVDEFIFDTLQGFCEHYASSFVYIMRAGGVPARVVGGYLGGEYNASGNYYLIHQFDAHAWAEIWIEDKGWIRVDPTAWIAPERVNRGIQESLPDGESILDGNLLSARKYNPLTKLRLQMDYLNMSWDQWVLGYDEEMQNKILEKILGKVSPLNIALFMGVCFGLVILGTILTFYIKDILSIKDPADRRYFKMLKKLQTKGVYREAYETPNEFSARLKLQNFEYFERVDSFTKSYIELKYLKNDNAKERNILLKTLAKQLSKI